MSAATFRHVGVDRARIQRLEREKAALQHDLATILHVFKRGNDERGYGPDVWLDLPHRIVLDGSFYFKTDEEREVFTRLMDWNDE